MFDEMSEAQKMEFMVDYLKLLKASGAIPYDVDDLREKLAAEIELKNSSLVKQN